MLLPAPGRRRRQLAQSAVEFGISLPVLISLVLGSLDLATYISDLQVAVSSVRAGARVASVLGGQACVVPPLSPAYPDASYVDRAIVKDVLTVAARLNFATVNQVIIYAPNAASGIYNPGTDRHSSYSGTGSYLNSNFGLDDRLQLVPNETDIGVEMDWSFAPPTGLGSPPLTNLRHYAVFKAMAVPSGC